MDFHAAGSCNRREGWLRVSPRIPRAHRWAVDPKCKTLLRTTRYAEGGSLIASLKHLLSTVEHECIAGSHRDARLFLVGSNFRKNMGKSPKSGILDICCLCRSKLSILFNQHFFYLNNEIIGRGYFLFPPPWREAEKEEKVDPKPQLRCNCSAGWRTSALRCCRKGKRAQLRRTFLSLKHRMLQEMKMVNLHLPINNNCLSRFDQ